jgi:hypothetical protein
MAYPPFGAGVQANLAYTAGMTFAYALHNKAYYASDMQIASCHAS